MKQNKPIFKKTLAFKLIDLGYKLVDVTPNERNPKYLIFYFEETQELIKDLEKLSK